MTFSNSFFRIFLSILLSAGAYIGLGYFTERTHFHELIGWFAVAFAVYGWWLHQNISLRTTILAAAGFRLLLLFAWPALSDDYFRFLWDGHLLAAGENPFLHLPDFYVAHPSIIPGLSPALFEQLNSPHYYSVYPPVCQYIFGLSSWLFPENNLGAIIVMRLFLLTAELGSFYLLHQLLIHYRQPARNIGWYALNPLVIVELTGNLHFEALMIFFLLAGLYFLIRENTGLAGVAFGLAVAVKMLPLLFLPLVLARLNWKKFIPFGLIIGLTVALLFLPFMSAELFRNIGHSLGLYFQKFEFNASIYYLLRELGFAIYGYNNISQIGPLLSFITLILIIYLAYQSRRSPKIMPVYFVVALSIYFFLATTVHPWYISTLAALAVFTPYRYVYVWSGAVLLSYATYQTSAYHENLYLTALEYILVFGWLIGELMRRRTGGHIKKTTRN